MEKCRFRRNENGAVLLTVLCVMLMMIILVGASISFVNTTTKKTYRTFQAEQAYMTASTCLETFVNKIEYETNLSTNQALQKDAIENLVALSQDNDGKGYEYDVLINDETDIEKMGSCTIRVSTFNDTTIVITATAKFGSEEEQVAAYVQTDTKPRRASFSNAIEICQDTGGTFNNLHVLGDMATITGKDKTQTYYLRNEMSTDGALVIYGNTIADANPGVVFGPGASSDSVGGRMMVWGNFKCNNPFNAKTTMAKSDTNDDNFILVKGTVTIVSGLNLGNVDAGGLTGATRDERTNKGEVDLYCEGFKVQSNGFKALGNIVVYGGGTFDVSSATDCEIYGDLVVDGTIIASSSNKVTVHGNIYCSGDIPANIQVADASKNARIPNQPVPTGGRFKVPTMEETYNEYEYYPEDLIANPNSSIGKLKNKYDALHTGSEKKMLDVYNKNVASGYSYSGGGCTVTQAAGSSLVTVKEGSLTSEYFGVIDESCVFSNEWTQANGDGSTPVKTLSGNSGEHKNGKLLVHVTDQDILILIRNEGNGSGESTKHFADAPTIVVKNDSSDSNPHFCYFVTDAGKEVGIVAPDAPSTVTGKRRNQNDKVDFGMFKSKIIDYELYSQMFSSNVLLAENDSLPKTCNDPNNYNTSFALNMTDSEIDGATKLPNEKIIYLFTNGSGYYSGQESFHEGIIYGPEGKYNCETQAGIQFPKVYTTPDTCKTSVPIMSLGMIITGNFYNKNDSYYGFNAPDEASILSIVKKAKESQLSGYKLIRYEHH